MIDLHSHLLPGVDDGSRSVEQSVRVLHEMAQRGIAGVCLTPHLNTSRLERGVPPAHDAAFAALQAAAPEEVRLYRGAEIMLDRPLASADEARRVALGGSRYLLVEFPRLVARETVTHALTRVLELGLVPVLAHPERYSSCSLHSVYGWRVLGAKMQVDATTLLSTHGRGERARGLVAAGFADILAADNHGDGRMLDIGRQFLLAHDGAVQATLLTSTNPAAIVADEPLEPVPPLELRTSWLQRIRRFFAGGPFSGEEL